VDDLGLTSYKELIPAMISEKRWQLLKIQAEEVARFGTDASFEKMLAEQVGPPKASKDAGPVQQPQNSPETKQTQSPAEPSASHSTKRTQSARNIPRNAPCPCHSGQKYKRCCGTNAAPVLFTAAA
jgi:preprotein translocase subunit SecA